MNTKSGPRDPTRLIAMRQLTNSGMSMREMEKVFGVSRQYIHRYLDRHKNVVIKSDKAIVE